MWSSLDRVAAQVFGAVAFLSVPLYLYLGRRQSFFLDEWDFLTSRHLSSVRDLLRPHNEHWSTLPIIAYRSLWSVFGLHTYWPYQVMVVLLHVTTACLLWIVMRRSGINSLIAASAGVSFVLLGSGHQDILWGFQIGFNAALALGLTHIILADHDGGLDRRDAFGVVIGALGLLCSGVAVTMVFVVGLAMLLSRGVRAAAFHTVPLAFIFTLWWFGFGSGHTSFSFETLRFVGIGITNAFGRMGQVWGVGLLLAVMTVAGLARLRDLRRAAVPVALLAGGLVFLLISGSGRVDARFMGLPIGAEYARASRYVHVFVALALPAIALGVDALARRWPALLPVVVVLLLAGVPGNLRAAQPHGIELGGTGAVERLAYSPDLERLAPDSNPLGPAYPGLTVEWVAEAKAQGRVPRPSDGR